MDQINTKTQALKTRMDELYSQIEILETQVGEYNHEKHRLLTEEDIRQKDIEAESLIEIAINKVKKTTEVLEEINEIIRLTITNINQ